MSDLDLFDKFLNSLDLEDESDWELAERMKQYKKVYKWVQENRSNQKSEDDNS